MPVIVDSKFPYSRGRHLPDSGAPVRGRAFGQRSWGTGDTGMIEKMNALRISCCQKGITNMERGKSRINPVVFDWK